MYVESEMLPDRQREEPAHRLVPVAQLKAGRLTRRLAQLALGLNA